MNHGSTLKTRLTRLLAIVVTLALTVCSNAWAQQQEGTITGQVTDAETGETIPGVNVVIVGTTQGDVTREDGRYRITIAPGTYALQASFIGYATMVTEGVSVTAGEISVVDFVLEESALELDDVIVTALGVEREERSLTYSAQDVDISGVSEARELNVANSLAGQVAGMSVTRAGTGLGGSARVILRGNRSINGNSQPLYVVDGAPIRGEISDLNPDDIEKIYVLKGPNAAALYGSAAQNGAVVITTRRARPGQLKVNFSSTYTFEDAILLTDYQNVYGQGTGGLYQPSSEFNFGPRMDGQMVDHWAPGGDLGPQNGEPQQYAFTAQPDNVADFFQTGYNSSTNLTASAGTDKIQSLVSYSFTTAEGVVPGNELERHNIQVRANSTPTRGLTLDGKVSFMRQNIDQQLPTGESFENPIRHAFRLPRNVRTEDVKQFEFVNQEGVLRQNFWNPGSNGGANPYWTVNRNLFANFRERAIVLASAKYDFTDALSMLVRGSYDGESGGGEAKYYNNSYIIADNGRYTTNKYNGSELNTDFLLSYTSGIGEDISFDANFGGNMKKQRNTSLFSSTGNALTVPNFFAISNTQNPVTTHGRGAPVDVNSLYGFGQIGWKDAVYLDVTGRNDWSSTLPEDNRSYFYPSVGLSAVVSDLINLPSVLDFLQVRGSWAKVGNAAPYGMLQRTAIFTAGGNNGFIELRTVLPNAELKPEETVSSEVGLDMRFFNGRLGFDASLYKMNTKNQLFTVALPVGSGASSFFTNGGDVENKGLELMVSGTPIRTRDFSWGLNVNFATNRNEVVKISDERPSLTIAQDFLREFRIVEGEEFGSVYSRGFQRDSLNRVIIGSNGMPLITNGLNVKVANYNPDWLGSIRSTFSYRNFSASILIDHRQGGSIASLTNAVIYADGLVNETLDGREGGLIFGENFFAHEETVLAEGVTEHLAIDSETFWRGVGGRNAPVGEVFAVSATNTRVREITLGYRVPTKYFGSVPVSAIRISVVGRNLFFINRESKNLDPDLMIGTFNSAEGFESFAPPTTRTYGVHLAIEY